MKMVSSMSAQCGIVWKYFDNARRRMDMLDFVFLAGGSHTANNVPAGKDFITHQAVSISGRGAVWVGCHYRLPGWCSAADPPPPRTARTFFACPRPPELMGDTFPRGSGRHVGRTPWQRNCHSLLSYLLSYPVVIPAGGMTTFPRHA